MRVLMLFFTRLGTARLPPVGRFMCMAIDGRAIVEAAADGRCIAGMDVLAGGDFGPDGPGFGPGFAAIFAGGATDFGPGFAAGIVGCCGAVIAAAILAEGETMTGAAAFAGTRAFISFEDSCMPAGGGAGFGPVAFEVRVMPETGGAGNLALDRAGAGLPACGGILLGVDCSIMPGGGGDGFGPVDESSEAPAAGGGGAAVALFLSELPPSCGGLLGRTLSASDLVSADGRSAVVGRSAVACSYGGGDMLSAGKTVALAASRDFLWSAPNSRHSSFCGVDARLPTFVSAPASLSLAFALPTTEASLGDGKALFPRDGADGPGVAPKTLSPPRWGVVRPEVAPNTLSLPRGGADSPGVAPNTLPSPRDGDESPAGASNSANGFRSPSSVFGIDGASSGDGPI